MKKLLEKSYPLIEGDTLRVLNNAFPQLDYRHKGEPKKVTVLIEIEE